MNTLKIVFATSILLTYPVYLLLFVDRPEFPHVIASIMASFLISFIMSDIIIRIVMELLTDKIPGRLDQLEESHIAQLFSAALAKEIKVVDVYHDNFYISIRTLDTAPNGIYRVDFFALDPDNSFNEDCPYSYISFIDALNFKEFRNLFKDAYDDIVKKGKEYYK